MATRIWMDIPANSNFFMKLEIVDGNEVISASGIFDPEGPAFDAPWKMNELLETVQRQIDINSTASIEARYLKPETTTVEISAWVEDAGGDRVADTARSLEYRQRFTGSGPGGKTELAFYLYRS